MARPIGTALLPQVPQNALYLLGLFPFLVLVACVSGLGTLSMCRHFPVFHHTFVILQFPPFP